MYDVGRKKQMISWKDILGMTKYYDHIFLCIIRGLIFAGNLKYAIVFNKKNSIGVQDMEN